MAIPPAHMQRTTHTHKLAGNASKKFKAKNSKLSGCMLARHVARGGATSGPHLPCPGNHLPLLLLALPLWALPLPIRGLHTTTCNNARRHHLHPSLPQTPPLTCVTTTLTLASTSSALSGVALFGRTAIAAASCTQHSLCMCQRS